VESRNQGREGRGRERVAMVSLIVDMMEDKNGKIKKETMKERRGEGDWK